MTPFLIYSVAAVVIFVVALRGSLIQPHLLRKIVALNIMGSSVFLLLIALAQRNAAPAPDPVPQAMVLTGIVVAVSTTALALVIARQLHMATGLDHLPDEDDDR